MKQWYSGMLITTKKPEKKKNDEKAQTSRTLLAGGKRRKADVSFRKLRQKIQGAERTQKQRCIVK